MVVLKEKAVINRDQVRLKDSSSKTFLIKIALKKATIIFSKETIKKGNGKMGNYLLMERLAIMKEILNKA